jgi:hypothetical protein
MSNRGGVREGAGRKRGLPNKKTLAQLTGAAIAGEMPLQYMLSVMRDPTVDDDRRDDMAKAAAPYLHPKLSPIEPKEPEAEGQQEPEITGASLPDFVRVDR